jgi:signal peptide peptidase SppA
MTTATHPLIARFQQTEALVAEDRSSWFASCVQHLIRGPRAEELLATSDLAASGDDFWPAADSWMASYRPYIVRDGVLRIPVQGALMNKFGFVYGRWATGYTYIEKALERGLADANVRGIALICDSPGGEVSGCFELADKIHAARSVKPIRAFAADAAYSAAYALASSASKVDMTRSGGVGSIGVVTMHVDYSKALDAEGVKITFIFAGKHKVDGNPYEALPADVKTRIQGRIDRLYTDFCQLVAKNRRMEESAVRKTEALTYGSDEAVEKGLADKVGVFEESLEAFASEISADTGDTHMADKTEEKTVPQAQHDAAVAAARAEGVKAGATAERSRFGAILALAALAASKPVGRFATALKMATTTDLSPEQIDAIVADVPEASAPVEGKQKTPFETAMEKSGNPDVGGSGGDKGDKGDKPIDLMADFAAATGYKPRKTA